MAQKITYPQSRERTVKPRPTRYIRAIKVTRLADKEMHYFSGLAAVYAAIGKQLHIIISTMYAAMRCCGAVEIDGFTLERCIIDANASEFYTSLSATSNVFTNLTKPTQSNETTD
jgi:hypothetical protein